MMKRLAELTIYDWYFTVLRLSFFLSSKFISYHCLDIVSLGT